MSADRPVGWAFVGTGRHARLWLGPALAARRTRRQSACGAVTPRTRRTSPPSSGSRGRTRPCSSSWRTRTLRRSWSRRRTVCTRRTRSRRFRPANTCSSKSQWRRASRMRRLSYGRLERRIDASALASTCGTMSLSRRRSGDWRAVPSAPFSTSARSSTWSRPPRREWPSRTPAGSATPSRWAVPVR